MTPEADARMQRARELLAREYEREGLTAAAHHARRSDTLHVHKAIAVRAIAAALSEQTDAREAIAPVWRRGVRGTVAAIDLLMHKWKASKRESDRVVAERLNEVLQTLHDVAGELCPTTYTDAAAADQVMQQRLLALIGKAPGA